MKRLAFVLLSMACAHAHAVDWICTTSQTARVTIAQAELPEGATASGAAVGTTKRAKRRASIRQVDRTDLIQAYSGQPVLMGHTWLLAVMLPASHPDTRAAFSELGLSPEAAERMASGTGLIDRGIRVVQTPDQLIQKVGINPPAVGYSSIFFGARDVASCF
jgi:hypothetical protein